MRILTVGNMYPPHHYGGYELVWQGAVEHLARAGHEVAVLTTDTRTGATTPDPPFVHRELRWALRNGEFEPLGPRQRVALARHNHRALNRQLAALRPQVVAWWSMGGLNLTMLESVRRAGIGSVAFVHDDWLDYGRWADAWLHTFRGRRQRLAPLAERLTGVPARVDFERSAEYVFVSEHTRAHARRQGLNLPRTAVAHSGIHADFLVTADERPWSWQLLYVGRLDPRKGVDTAIQALSHLPPQARLALAGGWDTREEDRLRSLAAQLRLTGRVQFLGQLDRAATVKAYAAADVVVFPVIWEEPWGLVPLEAMASGRPVVATGRGGSREYLRDGENSLLFSAGDPRGLAAAVDRLAEDADLRSRLRQAGIATARGHTEAIFNGHVQEAIERAGAPVR